MALAIVIFVRSLRHDPASPADSAATPSFRVFDGPSSGSRFSDALSRIIAAVPVSDVHLLGAEQKQLGTHSVRKGAAAYCAGMLSGPSTVQVFLRAGWSLGNVQDRYLFAGAGGDQLTGRVLAGLPFTDTSFASLPPHFDKEGSRLISWDSVLPLHTRLPETLKQALPHLLASICYHESWLRATLAPNHPLFTTQLFASGHAAALRPHVVTGCRRCEVTGMEATGVPPHLVLANELNALASRTDQLKEELLQRYSDLPNQLANVMLSKLTINGAVPITRDSMREMLDSVMTQMRAEIREAHSAGTLSAAARPPSGEPSESPFKVWTWGEKLHMVPEDWQFPCTNLKDTWNLWHFGHLTERIRPLLYLKKYDLNGSGQVTRWSKAKRVMEEIGRVMVQMHLVRTMKDVRTLTAAESSQCFDRAIVQFMEQLRPGSTQGSGRWMDMAIATVYALVLRKRKRRREEHSEGEVDDAAAAEALSQMRR